MKRAKKKWKWGLAAFFLVLALALWGIGMLIYMDKHYVCLHSLLVRILGRENHFDGGLWFSAAVTLVSTFISAIPGLLCGVLAYIQTERLHSLEDRYHRPNMELRKAQIGAVDLNFDDEDMLTAIKANIPESAYVCRNGVEQAYKRRYPFYIYFETDFCVKNDITIKGINIKQIELRLGNACWQIDLPGEREAPRFLMWDFNREIGESGMVYTLKCSLCPPKGTQDKDKTDAFWEAVRDFFYYGSVQNPVHQYMILDIRLNVIYEYGERDGDEGILHMEFDAKRNLERNRYALIRKACNGFFSFDIS